LGKERFLKIVDAYMKFGLYDHWNEAVTTTLENNGHDPHNSDLFLAVCEQMELDDAEYPILEKKDCLSFLKSAAEKAFQSINPTDC
jgi:hypothetical protein